MPTYYIMDRAATMAETVVPYMPDTEAIAACAWMPDAELAVYSTEFARTGFQGGLNWYRARLDPLHNAELAVYAGRTIDAPSMFISGARDWGTYQAPGALERMQADVCRRMRGCHLIEGAGHWVMQEQSATVARLLAQFGAETDPF